jgi:DNA polymerase-3 subunit gamma/tau
MMSDFIVSARKYRPKDFDSVVGQASITSTLKNAIRSKQVAQSFLFCGPRGVGKTSCARILAKTINCEKLSDNIESCNECISCKSFDESASFNVHELDAASNNSVDDIRNLVDQVRFSPQVGLYNIYIIDEVHMLSNSAFNAFLKTLEEPPKHAKFILATTEKHKIIPTILSRCQIFDFKRVSISDISDQLSFVAKSEGIAAEKEALHLIAQKSDGAMRDSLSMFDRFISFSDKNITYKSVIEHLNILDYDYYFKLTESLLKNDINQLLNIYNEILENGFDGHHFINGLADHLRDILISKDESTIKLLEKSSSLKTRYLDQSKNCEIHFLLSALNLCNDCDIQYKNTNNQRLLVELTLMRISSIGHELEQKKNSKSFVVSMKDSIGEVSIEKIPEKIKREVILNTNDVEKTKEDEISNIDDIEERPSIRLNISEKKKASLISINASDKEAEPIENEDHSTLIVRDSVFSETELMLEWKYLIDLMNEKGKSNLGITLGVHKPKLKEEYLIELPLSNSAQAEMILEEKYMLLEYLRKKLDNDKIELVTRIVDMEKSIIPYTNKDKFKKLLEENPKLENLRVKLGLDPDY